MENKNISLIKEERIKVRENINYDKLRHKLLGILGKKRIDVEKNHHIEEMVLGIPFDEILKELNINREELYVLTSQLYENKEIGYYRKNFIGLYAKRLGVASYYTRKYLKKKKIEKRGNVKFWFNIIVPVLSLFIATFTIITKSQIQKEELKEVKQEISDIKRKLGNLEINLLEKQDDSVVNNIKNKYLKKK